MPRILIVTDAPGEPEEVVYAEQVVPVHLASEHAGRLLVERLGWALEDARRAERHRDDSRIGGHGVDLTGSREERKWIPT